MNLLLTGGAGYIGSILAARLISAGQAVTVPEPNAEAMASDAWTYMLSQWSSQSGRA